MSRTTVVILAMGVLSMATQVDAQGWRDQQDRRSRQDIARAQGVSPGQLPPAGLCRVWYDNRAPGRQPSATNCREAERTAARTRNARVIYGDGYGGNGYDNNGYDNSRDPRYPDTWGTNDRAVGRDGRVRDPRAAQDRYGREQTRYTTPAFQSGYRDGVEKGREDADDNDRYDPNRHGWYRSATRGYEDEYGSKAEYQVRYREAFNSGYAEGYRTFARR